MCLGSGEKSQDVTMLMHATGLRLGSRNLRFAAALTLFGQTGGKTSVTRLLLLVSLSHHISHTRYCFHLESGGHCPLCIFVLHTL